MESFSPKPINDTTPYYYDDEDSIDVEAIKYRHVWVAPLIQFMATVLLLILFLKIGYECGRESVHNLAIDAKVGDFVNVKGQKVFVFIRQN